MTPRPPPPSHGDGPPGDSRNGSFASLMIAGVNAKALSTFMGHANIGITLGL